MFVNRGFLYGPAPSRGRGDRSGHGGFFVAMNDGFVFTMDEPVDRNNFFGRIILSFTV